MAKKQTRRSVSVRGTTYAAIRTDCTDRGVSLSDYIEALIAADRKARGLSSTDKGDGVVARAVDSVQREGERQVERAARAVQAATAAAPRRPEFRRKDGEVSLSQRIWEWMEQQDRPVSAAQASAAVKCPVSVAVVAMRKWRLDRFIDGVPGAYRIASSLPSPLPATSSIKAGPPPAQTAMLGRTETPARRADANRCPCCGRATMRSGVRCSACSITCTRRDDGTWVPGRMCPMRATVPSKAPVVEARPAHGERVEPIQKPQARNGDPLAAVRTGRDGQMLL